MLGLGGGIMPTYLEAKCPGIKIINVDYNQDVVTAARDFFAFTGDVIVQDMHDTLKDLASKQMRFDFIFADTGQEVLDDNDMRNVYDILKPSGMVIENLPDRGLVARQIRTFKAFLDNVEDQQVPDFDNIVI